ncbi:hypothetical protein QTL95_25485 [Rhizobium sp. S152]|uniref:hypothetical protein n=1 Tax=Rhizobium sp. S152 TaxID=3055038 RepID=UPI0025A95F5E|nr:hypothetical protein [Rhizobium sp. S152]MDM9629248.1 hypothetical protein [Rhizobium sp. S152]
MRNVLVTSCRRRRLSRDEARLSLSRLTQLPLVTRTIADSVAVFDLAEHHQLTAYDAAYLALAIDLTLSLATVDEKLMGAAAHQGVPLLR